VGLRALAPENSTLRDASGEGLILLRSHLALLDPVKGRASRSAPFSLSRERPGEGRALQPSAKRTEERRTQGAFNR